VAGLRRSEAAALAGVSVEHDAKLERGAIGGALSSVLDAIAEALQLDDTELAHLFDLARAADGIPASGRSAVAPRSTTTSLARACSGRWTPSPTWQAARSSRRPQSLELCLIRALSIRALLIRAFRWS
jgi:hypothetical protein